MLVSTGTRGLNDVEALTHTFSPFLSLSYNCKSSRPLVSNSVPSCSFMFLQVFNRWTIICGIYS